MNEIQQLQNVLNELTAIKKNAVAKPDFELSATLADHKNGLLRKIKELIAETETIIKYGELHLKN